MRLFVAIETSHLLRKSVPLSDPGQPWVVALAAELVDVDQKSLGFFSTRIRAEGRKIRGDAEAVHGISSRDAGRFGVSEIVALGMLSGLVAQAERVIGHAIVDFGKPVIEGVLIRKGKDPKLWARPGLEFVDTMLVATPFCKIEASPPREDGQYRWPSLDDACQILLGEEPPVERHPWASCQRIKRLHQKLLELGAFELEAA